MIRFRHTLMAVLALPLLLGAATAAEILYFEPHTGYKETFDSGSVPAKFQRTAAPHFVSSPAKAGNATFSHTYADVTAGNGIGFDHATFGAARRATAQAVTTYINNVLNTTPGSAPTLDVSFAVSQTDGTGFLASAGTFWFLGPAKYSPGFAFDHLTTGVDPLGGTDDIFCTFDFGYTWNSELDAVAGGEFDLATTMLHEMTHGLGFAGLSTSAGISTISGDLGSGTGVFSPFTDGFTKEPGVVDLFSAGFAFTGVAADLISDTLLSFSGTAATAANGAVRPLIYNPGSFATGSSLSHWRTASFPAEIMKHSVTIGTSQRVYGPVDIGALIDFGYTSAAAASPPVVPVEISSFQVR